MGLSGGLATNGGGASSSASVSNEFINPTSPAYGADATGVADATTAIQSACNDAAALTHPTSSVGKVILPPGSYKMSAQLNTMNVSFEGAGKRASALSWASALGAGTPYIIMQALAGSAANPGTRLAKFWLQGADRYTSPGQGDGQGPQSSIGIRSCNSAIIEDIEVDGCWAAINYWKDHERSYRIAFSGCATCFYIDTDSSGDMAIYDSDMNATLSCVRVSDRSVLETFLLQRCHLTSPFAFYKEYASGVKAGLMLDGSIAACSLEGIGNGVMYGEGVGSGALTAPLNSGGGAITTLPMNVVTTIPAGTVTVTDNAKHWQAWTTTGATAGATSLTVSSQTPNFSFPSGSLVTGMPVATVGDVRWRDSKVLPGSLFNGAGGNEFNSGRPTNACYDVNSLNNCVNLPLGTGTAGPAMSMVRAFSFSGNTWEQVDAALALCSGTLPFYSRGGFGSGQSFQNWLVKNDPRWRGRGVQVVTAAQPQYALLRRGNTDQIADAQLSTQKNRNNLPSNPVGFLQWSNTAASDHGVIQVEGPGTAAVHASNAGTIVVGDRLMPDPTNAGYVKKWGTVNAVQMIRVTGTPTGGTFTLKDSAGNLSSAINFNDAQAAIKTALEAITSIGAGNSTVSSDGFPGNDATVELTGATVAAKQYAPLQIGANSLTGGSSPTILITVRQPGGYSDEIVAIAEGADSAGTVAITALLGNR